MKPCKSPDYFIKVSFHIVVDMRQGESNIFQISTWKAFLLVKSTAAFKGIFVLKKSLKEKTNKNGQVLKKPQMRLLLDISGGTFYLIQTDLYIMPFHLSTSSSVLPRLNSTLPQSPVGNCQQPRTDHQKEIKKVEIVLHLYQ